MTTEPGAISNAMVERALTAYYDQPHSSKENAMRAALEAAVQSPPIVGVMALEWVNGETRSSRGDLYSVQKLSDNVRQLLLNGTPFPGWYTSDEHAKAAAQADYEARIRSALAAPVEAVATEPVAWRRIEHEYRPYEADHEAEQLRKRIQSFGSGIVAEMLTTYALAQPRQGSFAGSLWSLAEWVETALAPSGDSGALREALDGLNLLLGQAIHHLRNHDIYTHKTYADLANELQVWAKEHRAALSKEEPK